MTCDEREALLVDAVLGEPTGASSDAVEHARSCDRCGQVLDELRAARADVTLPALAPPDGLVERAVSAALRDRDVRPAGSLWATLDAWISRLGAFAMRPQAAMGMLLLIMVGSSLLFLRAKPGGPGSVQIREVGEPRAEDGAPGAPAGAPPPPPAAAARGAEGPQGRAAPAEAIPTEAPREEAAYAAAMGDFKARRWAEAIRGFEIVAQGGGPNASHAALYAARAARYSGGCGSAVGRFEAVASRYAGTGVALEAQWDAAVCYREVGQREQARLMFESLESTPAYRERAGRELAAMDGRSAGDAIGGSAKSGGVASPKAAAPSKPGGAR